MTEICRNCGNPIEFNCPSSVLCFKCWHEYINSPEFKNPIPSLNKDINRGVISGILGFLALLVFLAICFYTPIFIILVVFCAFLFMIFAMWFYKALKPKP